MRVAYVDTSCLVAVALGESQGADITDKLATYDRLYSDNLLEAELRSAFSRERIEREPDQLSSAITWVLPAEPLSGEYRTALGHGKLRGADLRHVACALYLQRLAGPIDFPSLDAKQRQVAATVGLANRPDEEPDQAGEPSSSGEIFLAPEGPTRLRVAPGAHQCGKNINVTREMAPREGSAARRGGVWPGVRTRKQELQMPPPRLMDVPSTERRAAMPPRKSGTTVAVVLALVISYQALPALAGDRLDLQTSHEWLPDSTRAHPRKMKLAIAVTDRTDLAFCELWYRIWRLQPGTPYVFPSLESGGKVKLSLKLISAAGKETVAKSSAVVEALPPSPPENVSSWRQAIVGWADSAVVRGGSFVEWNPKLTISDNFPLHVEPGDILQWTLTFKGMPKLEVDRGSEPPFWDELSLSTRCYSCGSADRPCPDES
jgi:hypothetical protein